MIETIIVIAGYSVAVTTFVYFLQNTEITPRVQELINSL